MTRQARPLDEIALPDRRRLERERFEDSQEYTVKLETNSGPMIAKVSNLTSTGMGIEFYDPQADVGSITRIHSLTVWYGSKFIAEIVEPAIKHFDHKTRQVGLEFGGRHLGPRQTRGVGRLNLNLNLSASAIFRDPIHLGGTVFCKILDLNLKGMKLTTSFSNKHLLPGATFSNVVLVLPLVDSVVVAFQIKHIAVDREQLTMGVEFLELENQAKVALGKYAMLACQHGNSGIEEFVASLNAAHVSLRHIGDVVKLQKADSRNLFLKALHVRFKAYSDANKLPNGYTYFDMADSYDEHSSTFLATVNGIAAATFRIVKRNRPEQTLPYEKLFHEVDLAGIGRNEIVEVCRVAILPELQGTNLLKKLFQFISVECGKRGKYMAITATRSLRPLYKKMGATEYPIEVPHPVIENDPLGFMVLPVATFITGESVSVDIWQATYREVAAHLVDFGFYQQKEAKSPLAIVNVLESLDSNSR